jgi:hypothetical protein
MIHVGTTSGIREGGDEGDSWGGEFIYNILMYTTL